MRVANGMTSIKPVMLPPIECITFLLHWGIGGEGEMPQFVDSEPPALGRRKHCTLSPEFNPSCASSASAKLRPGIKTECAAAPTLWL